jgi:hypothetical protein
MNSVRFPEGYFLQRLERRHPRKDFVSGEDAVDLKRPAFTV